MSSAEVSRLLVLGPDAQGREVISQLQQLCGDDKSSEELAVLHLRTKYYRAAVEAHVHEVKDNAPLTALQHALHDYEALLCVVDAAKTDSFVHIGRYAKKVVDTLPYDVCLLAASTTAASKESVAKLESWSQDNGFEFVDLNADQPEEAEDDVIDEKHGVERVLEALHCNMWRSMDMNVNDADAKAAKTEETENQKEATEDEIKADKDAAPEAANDDSRLRTLLQALEGADEGDDSDDDDDGAFDMSEFSALISQVRNVRDEGQTLTDEQRRERAAEVAMKLWNFLGADEDEGSESDSS